MYGTDSADNLHFTIWAKQLGSGLDEQLQRFVNEHPDTKLIIIDTLQKVREAGGDKFSYANDYEIVGKLKQFADKNHICLLLVHHTRKQQAEDKFDMISGTNGLLGAADGAFLLQKEKRTSDAATPVSYTHLDVYKRQAREGGMGIIHKNMSIEQQADNVDKVKRSEHGVISDPFSLSPDHTVNDADQLMGRYKISGVPIVEKDGTLIGICLLYTSRCV